MSYTSITPTEIQTGKPVSADTQEKIKDNFEDHEGRLLALEAGGAADYPPLVFNVNGFYSLYTTMNDVCRTSTNFSFNVVGVRLVIETAGSAGSTSIDIKKKTGGGAWTSIMSTQPSVAHSAGNDATSSNGVVNPSHQLILAGDLLRLDITGVQTGAKDFIVRIDYIHA